MTALAESATATPGRATVDVPALVRMMPADAALEALMAQGWSETDARTTVEAVGPRTDGQGRQFSLVPFSQIEAKATDWLWSGRVPRGMLSLLVGNEGEGKSALMLTLAAQLTLGSLEGDYKGQSSKVALLTTEDDPSRTMRPRIEAAGANMDEILNVKLKRDGQDSGVTFPNDAAALGRALGEAGVRWVIVDPLAACLDPKINTWKDTDIRSALTPLIVAAEEHDFALTGILHTNKRANATAREKAMGSVGYLQVVRSAMLLGPDPDDEDGRVLAHSKCNVGRLAPSLRIKLEEREVKIDGRPHLYPVAVIGQESEWSANDVARGVGNDSAKDRALQWLYGTLNDGPKLVADLQSEATKAGIAWRTLERAKRQSDGGIVSEHVGNRWAWKATGISF